MIDGSTIFPSIPRQTKQLNPTDSEQIFSGLKRLRDLLEKALEHKSENSLTYLKKALSKEGKSSAIGIREDLRNALVSLSFASEPILNIGERNLDDEPLQEGQERHPLQAIKIFLNGVVQEERKTTPKKEGSTLLGQFKGMIKVQNALLAALQSSDQYEETELHWIKVMAAVHCALIIKTGVACQITNVIDRLNYGQITEAWKALETTLNQIHSLQELFPELFSESAE